MEASIRLYTSAEHDPAAKAVQQRTQAVKQLEQALPLAAAANSADPTWNPLMTTLQEQGRIPEANLIAALEAQCATAQPTSGKATTAPVTGRTAGTGRTATRPGT